MKINPVFVLVFLRTGAAFPPDLAVMPFSREDFAVKEAESILGIGISDKVLLYSYYWGGSGFHLERVFKNE